MKDELAVAAVAMLLYLLSLAASFGIGYHKGSSSAEDAARATLAAVNAKHSKELEQSNQRERTTERNAVKVMNEHAARLQKELEDEQLKQKKFVAGVRSGAIRLSIPTRSPVCGAGTGPDTRTAPPDRDEARTELDPETASNLVAITTDGDNAIRQLNTCIDSFNTVRALMNKPAAHVQAQ